MGELKKMLFKKNVVTQVQNKVEKEVLMCEKHGEYEGFIMPCEGKDIKSICPQCLQDEIDLTREEREKEQRDLIARARIKAIFERSSFPKIFKDISFDDYVPADEKAAEVLSRMKKYADHFEQVRKIGSSVIFLGGTGTGKSMLSAAVGNAVMSKGFTVLYITCPQALSLIKRSWAKNSEISQDEYLEKFKKPDLLIMDEVPKGCNSKSDWELLHEIMNRRYMEERPTISISTLKEEKLRSLMTEEILRRMQYKGTTLHFTWESYKYNGKLW